MAQNVGPVDFASGTGVNTFNIGQTATWMQIYFQSSGNKPSKGFIYGGSQYCYSDDANPVNKAIQVKNTSGTVVFEGTFTSFSCNNVNFNITTNTLGTPRALLVFGN